MHSANQSTTVVCRANQPHAQQRPTPHPAPQWQHHSLCQLLRLVPPGLLLHWCTQRNPAPRLRLGVRRLLRQLRVRRARRRQQLLQALVQVAQQLLLLVC